VSLKSRNVSQPLLKRGPKHEILRGHSERYHLPFTEFNEGFLLTDEQAGRLDMERLKKSMWFPLSVKVGEAKSIVCDPDDLVLDEEMEETLKVQKVDKSFVLPSDLISGDRTHSGCQSPFSSFCRPDKSLARVRNALAQMRTVLAFHRTFLAKGKEQAEIPDYLLRPFEKVTELKAADKVAAMAVLEL
jgi:hypothetical protein